MVHKKVYLQTTKVDDKYNEQGSIPIWFLNANYCKNSILKSLDSIKSMLDREDPNLLELEEVVEDLSSLSKIIQKVECDRCRGYGKIAYPNTSTWRRGGASGQSITSGVCDLCWGTGRNDETGPNLRQWMSELKASSRERRIRWRE